MALSAIAERELDSLGVTILRLGKQSHHTPQEYPKAVATFIRIMEQGERAHPDDVRDWALAEGWSAQHARDLGEMADTVAHVLRQLGRI